jgi:hypothetical protein
MVAASQINGCSGDFQLWLSGEKIQISLITTNLKHLKDESVAKLEEHSISGDKNANISEMNLKVKNLENQNIIGMQELVQLVQKLNEEALVAAKEMKKSSDKLFDQLHNIQRTLWQTNWNISSLTWTPKLLIKKSRVGT